MWLSNECRKPTVCHTFCSANLRSSEDATSQLIVRETPIPGSRSRDGLGVIAQASYIFPAAIAVYPAKQGHLAQECVSPEGAGSDPVWHRIEGPQGPNSPSPEHRTPAHRPSTAFSKAARRSGLGLSGEDGAAAGLGVGPVHHPPVCMGRALVLQRPQRPRLGPRHQPRHRPAAALHRLEAGGERPAQRLDGDPGDGGTGRWLLGSSRPGRAASRGGVERVLHGRARPLRTVRFAPRTGRFARRGRADPARRAGGHGHPRPAPRGALPALSRPLPPPDRAKRTRRKPRRSGDGAALRGGCACGMAAAPDGWGARGTDSEIAAERSARERRVVDGRQPITGEKTQRKQLGRWCPGEDSNLHVHTDTST